MDILWIILAVLSFAGGQACLFGFLQKLDRLEESAVLHDEGDSGSGDFVIE